ncbi:E3 ubiquitin-protein ligase RNF14 [Carex littledalei]|uniref:E3 ubiquitin-protein ligase RNF14 n=1 Tax=Carex littledalei TaxID=544730 RepID=A0A833QZK5_9POAL|nr:E3 ubiquitin-protein ligase RNF14 [Carex littledalei]
MEMKRATKGRGFSSSSLSQQFCKICMENVPANKMFKTSNACPHVFCRVCLTRYLFTKIRENISVVKCPEGNCKVVLEPVMCKELLPFLLFRRWAKAVCESMLLGEGKRAEEDLLMMQLAKEKNWMRCASCKYFVEKTDGCLHITCR